MLIAYKGQINYVSRNTWLGDFDSYILTFIGYLDGHNVLELAHISYFKI